MSICKGCGEEKKLIKAHSIPESFFKKLNEEGISAKFYTDIEGRYPKRSHIGPYDENILCRECEDRFQIYDDYGQKILLQEEDRFQELLHDGEVCAFQINNVDVKKLRLFLMSVIWRASISDHEFYSNVKLGPYESKLRDLIWRDEEGDFPFVIAKFTDPDLGRCMLDPHMEQWSGVNYCRLYMYGYIIHIKVDQSPSPEAFKVFEISDTGVLTVIARDIHDSAELSIIQSAVNNSKK